MKMKKELKEHDVEFSSDSDDSDDSDSYDSDNGSDDIESEEDE